MRFHAGSSGSPALLMMLALLMASMAAACRPEEAAETPPADRTTVPPRIVSVGGLQARDTEIEGLVADLLTATRQAGLLTVAVRFRNTGTDTVAIAIPADAGSYPSVRLEAGGSTWPIARDEPGTLGSHKAVDRRLAPGQSVLWRATFEAPPPGIAAFDLALPGLRVPFRNVPITDRGGEPTAGEEIRGEQVPPAP